MWLTCKEIEDLELEEYLGSGYWREVFQSTYNGVVQIVHFDPYSFVLMCLLLWIGTVVAVKLVKEERLESHKSVHQRHVHEIGILQEVTGHENILQILGACDSTIITEFLPVTLDKVVFDEANSLSIEQKIVFCKQAASAMDALHSLASGPLVHGDLQVHTNSSSPLSASQLTSVTM